MKARYWCIPFLVLLACSAEEKNSTTVDNAQKMFDAFNRHDWNAMSKCYAAQASFLDPSFGKDFVTKSREETVTKYAEMEKMFPDIHDSIREIYQAGDRVVIEFTSTGKAADGTSFSLPIISVLTFHDGLIIKDATYYDQ